MSGPPPLTQTILLVDGELRTSKRLAGLLGEDGFEVQVVRDGAAAIARLSRAPLPRTLITELSVPLADGAAIARYARSLDPHVRVIVLTRHPHLLAAQGFAPPAPIVLTKPLDYARLLELLGAEVGPEIGAEVGAERGAAPAGRASSRV